MTLLLTLLLKSLLVFAAAGLLLLALRRSSAAARHLVCLLTLGAVLLLPLCSLSLPGWHLPVLGPPTPAQAPSPPATGRVGVSEGPVAMASLPAPSQETSTPPAPQPALHSPALPVAGGEGACAGVGGLYLFGLFLASLRPLLGLWGIHRLSRHCTNITDAPTLSTAADCAQTLGLPVPRLCRAEVPVPMTWGWRRPVIVLPPVSADWPNARLRSVLLHEMAHVKRRDWPGHRLADFACAVYWFHPLVWLTARRLRTESELACDDLVLASGVPAPDYARHLLEIASALPRVSRRSHTAIAMAQTSRIESRLSMILDKTQSRRTVTRRVLLTALIPGTAALVTLAVLRPDAKAQASPSTAGASSPAVTSSQPPLLFLWPSGSSVQISFKPGGGTTFIAHPDLMTMTTTTTTPTPTMTADIEDRFSFS